MAIQKQTRLKIADNSGALEVQCFHIIGSTGKKKAYLGDKIICAVKKAIPGGQVKKGEVITAVIVRMKNNCRRVDGSYISFSENAAVVLKNKTEKDPKGSRVFGPIAKELRDKGFSKIVSLAPEVL